MLLEMKIPSPGESISEVEIAQWLVMEGDYVFQDQSIVEVDSAITNPGLYEALSGESVYDIIQYAGGPSFDASGIVGISRLNTNNPTLNKSTNKNNYLDYSSTKLVNVIKGDKIFLQRIFQEVKQVEILGQVKSPGNYIYYNGMTFQDLINLSGGFKDSTYLKSVYKGKAQILSLIHI